MKNIQIALDGPAGAGKSTIAKAIAKKLSIIYLDTGALYRSIAYFVITSKMDVLDALHHIKIEVKYIENEQKIYVNGEDVSSKIRTNEVSLGASNVSKYPEVRTFLLDLQRDIASKTSCVLDGRDIGTVVLPNADVKIFLTADVEKRAMRRFLEAKDGLSFEKILEDVKKRDAQDENRDVAPLKPAEDAIILDTGDFSLEQSIEAVLGIILNKIGE